MSMSVMLSSSTTSLIFISKQRRSIILEIVLVCQPGQHLDVELNPGELSVVNVVNYLLHGLLVHLFHSLTLDIMLVRRIGELVQKKFLWTLKIFLLSFSPQEIFSSVVLPRSSIYLRRIKY